MLLPIGEIDDKRRVRQIALDLGLDVHDKPDSQEICFVPDDDYINFLRQRTPEALRPGQIVDSSGKVLGRHEGYACYTIGQRRGLRIAAGVPMYVVDIDPVSACVTIGPREEVLTRRCRALKANWHGQVPEQFDATVQIRYRHAGAAARVRAMDNDAFEVDFEEDVSAVTPGQAAVVYDGDVLLGGGWIERDVPKVD